MERRKFVVGLSTLATGTAAATGTGALSSVEADRNVSVQTAGDADAYLGIAGDDTYVTDDSGDGRLTIDLGGPSNPNSNTGEGFNEHARTTVEEVVTITNQGTAPVEVSLDSPDSDNVARDGSYVRLSVGGKTVKISMGEGSTERIKTGKSTTLDATVDDRSSEGSGTTVQIVAEEVE